MTIAHSRVWKTASFIGCLVGVLIIATLPAYAHTPSPGLKGFWTGVLHPLTDPAQMLMILASVFWLGLQTRETIKRQLMIFIIACFSGVAIGLTGLQDAATFMFGVLAKPAAAQIYTATLLIALIASFLAATAHQKAQAFLPIPIAFTGLVAGYINVPDAGAVTAFSVTLLGSVFAIFYILIAGSVGLLEGRIRVAKSWTPIALRTASAWIAAISALMLALQYIPQG